MAKCLIFVANKSWSSRIDEKWLERNLARITCGVIVWLTVLGKLLFEVFDDAVEVEWFIKGVTFVGNDVDSSIDKYFKMDDNSSSGIF